MYTLHNCDALKYINDMADESVNLVIADPPYGQFAANKCLNNSAVDAAWNADMIARVAPKIVKNGALYWFCGSFAFAADIHGRLKENRLIQFNSFCILKKEKWRLPTYISDKNNLRSWFNVCEYALYYNRVDDSAKQWNQTGLAHIHSNPSCFASLKTWYRQELAAIGKTERQLREYYTQITGRKPHMFRHYFCNSQFEMPTQHIYNTVFVPFGFTREYESLCREYESLRYYHQSDSMHCNVFAYTPSSINGNRRHPCQKPVGVLDRFVRVSCPPVGVVFDPFMGSGSTGVAAVQNGRDFIGCELDKKWYAVAQRRIKTVFTD